MDTADRRERARLASRKYYYKNREARIALSQRKAERNRAIVHEAKSVPCAECGVSYPPYVMDFHHTDPTTKDKTVGTMLTYSEARLRAEIAKCVVVCANCHREIENGKV